MGGLLAKIFGGPASDLVKSVGGIIDNLNTSDAEKLEAQRKLVELQLSFSQKMAEIDGDIVKAQAGVVTAEVQSKSWLASSWRPILMLVFTYIVAHNYVIAPIFHAQIVPIPPDLWELLRIGMGGYIAGRTVEKIAAPVANAIAAKK